MKFENEGILKQKGRKGHRLLLRVTMFIMCVNATPLTRLHRQPLPEGFGSTPWRVLSSEEACFGTIAKRYRCDVRNH